jgi:hypothetical protein
MIFLTLKEDLPCYNCIHRTGEETCKAFPNGIPEIFNNGSDVHVVKHPGQTGDFLLEETKEYEERMAEVSRKANERGIRYYNVGD